MAYTARHATTDELHNVALADPEAEYRCLDCDELLSYVRQHARATPSGGSTSVTAHFSHRGGGGGGGGCDGTGGGESQIHKRRKRDALQEAVNRFEAADYDTEVTVGEKRADALLTFDEPHEKYGTGLVIEYQHKNEGKDIPETEQHFARNEYTTVWLWEDQYTYDGEIPDIDLFGGRVYTPWPDAVPATDRWSGPGHNAEKRREWARAYDRGLTDAVVEATIVKDWVLPTPREYWQTQGWGSGFRKEQLDSTEDYRLRAAVAHTSSLKIEANIVAHWYLPTPQEYWESQQWDLRFRNEQEQSVEDFRLQAAVSHTTTLSVEANIVSHWYLPTQLEYWNRTQWQKRFPELAPDWKEPPVPTEMMIRKVSSQATSGQREIPVSLPPEVGEEIKATNSSTSDGRRCPRCGSEAAEHETENWATVYRCPEGHWSRQTGYKGETQAPPYNG